MKVYRIRGLRLAVRNRARSQHLLWHAMYILSSCTASWYMTFKGAKPPHRHLRYLPFQSPNASPGKSPNSTSPYSPSATLFTGFPTISAMILLATSAATSTVVSPGLS